MIRARFAELRAADPCLYVIERIVPVQPGIDRPQVDYMTSYNGSHCFLARDLSYAGGVFKSREACKDGGGGLAVFDTRSYAELALKCFQEKFRNLNHARSLRVREVDKKTGELVPVVE
jgi:hypothetical protein